MSLTADQLRGRVKAIIDGKSRTLRFDQNALANLIEVLSLNGLASLPNALSSLDADILKVLVWAGCLHEEPDLERESVSKWFYPMIPTYIACIEGINLAIWGDPTGDSSESEEENDDSDPQRVPVEVGTSEEQSDLH